MTATTGYTGLSGRERSTIGTAIGFTMLVLLLALLRVARDVVPTISAPAAVLKVFDVPPPPPRPEPVYTRSPERPMSARPRARGSAPREASRSVPASLAILGGPVAIAPVALEPVVTLPDQPIGLGPAVGTGLSGRSGAGAIGGSGEGDGEGKAADADRRPLLTAAVWVRRPTREDFQREWPRNGYALTMPVDVVLVCAVKESGRPFHCSVSRESEPGRGFGQAAIRIAEASLVRPALRDGRSNPRVIVPLTFMPAGTHPTPTSVPVSQP